MGASSQASRFACSAKSLGIEDLIPYERKKFAAVDKSGETSKTPGAEKELPTTGFGGTFSGLLSLLLVAVGGTLVAIKRQFAW